MLPNVSLFGLQRINWLKRHSGLVDIELEKAFAGYEPRNYPAAAATAPALPEQGPWPSVWCGPVTCAVAADMPLDLDAVIAHSVEQPVQPRGKLPVSVR